MLGFQDFPTMSVNSWHKTLNLLPNPVLVLKKSLTDNSLTDEIVYANQAYQRLIAPTPQDNQTFSEWLNQTFPHHHYQELIKEKCLHYSENDNSNHVVNFSCPLQCADNSNHWFNLTIQKDYLLGGNLRLITLAETTSPEESLAELQNVTIELTESYAELQKQKDLLKQTQTLAKVGSWELDLKTGQMQWSDEIFKMHGVEPNNFSPSLDYLVSKSVGDDSAKLKSALQTAIVTGKQQHLTHRIRRPDGSIATLELSGFIEYNEANQPIKAVGSSSDISEILKLQNSNNELATIMQLAHQEIYVYSLEQNRFLFANQSALQNLGYNFAELQQLNIEQISPELNPQRLQKLSKQDDPQKHNHFLVHQQRRKDGSLYPVKSSFQNVYFENQAAIASFQTDITHLKKVEETLRQQNHLLENILESVPLRIFWKDIHGNFIGANHNFLKDLNIHNLDELIGKNDLDINWPSGQSNNYFKQDMSVLKDGHSFIHMEDAFIDHQGDIRIWLMSKIPLRDINGKITGMLGSYQDISDHRQLEIRLREQAEELQYQAFHDNLTQLPNRAYLHKQIEREIQRAKRSNKQFALLFIDLDHFKQINDSLGHDTGDRVLQKMAKTLRSSLRKGDTIARLGGDEFTVLQTPINSYHDASSLAQKLLLATSQPVVINDHTFYLSNSIGISIYPKDADNADTLLKSADAAMYRAKERGRNNFQFYTEDLTKQAFEHLSKQTKIRQAIDRNEFIPFFQPQIDANTGKVIGLEVLSRWEPAPGKLIPPSEFIPIAEKTGQIIQLDRQVFIKALRDFVEWRSNSSFTGRLSLNLAVKQLKQDDFLDFLTTEINNANCQWEWLEFEITESDIMTSLEEMSLKLHQFRDLGAHIAIDDFGTGYSSLAYLKKLPVTKLKIDRSFVSDLSHDEDDAIITKTIISMAKNLDLEVIAEGVETDEQKAFLLENGCHLFQGYLFAKPMTAVDITNFLTKT